MSEAKEQQIAAAAGPEEVAGAPGEAPAEKPADQTHEHKTRRQNGKSSTRAVEEPQHTRLRLLCPLGMAGGVIGKKGECIMKIRKETNTQVAVEDYVPGSEERVVTIVAERLQPDGSESTSAEDALCSVFERMCVLAHSSSSRRRGGGKAPAAAAAAAPVPAPSIAAAVPAATVEEEEEAAVKGEGASAPEEGSSAEAAGAEGSGEAPAAANGHHAASEASESEASSSAAVSAGDAAAVAAGAAADGGAGAAVEEGAPPVSCAARMLVDSSQIGYLVGKNGASIKSTTACSGASIRILTKSELPPCACVTDEVVMVTGSQEQVRAALRLLGAQQRRHPPRGALPGAAAPLLLGQASHPDLSLYHGVYGVPGLLAAHSHPHAVAGAAAAVPFHHHPPHAAAGMAPLFSSLGGGAAAAGASAPVEVTFRLLVPVGKAGNIIGRSGEHIRRIRGETGARIKVHDLVGESEERLVSVSSTEEALAAYCAAQDALIRCVISLTSDDPPASLHRVRLLTSQASVGVVLGKKGHTVTQLRAETGAAIKVLPADGLSLDEANPDEVVQVEGNMQQCISALRGVATLLRGWQIRRQAKAAPPPSSSGSPQPSTLLAQPVPLSPAHSGMLQFYGNGVMSSPGHHHHHMAPGPMASFRYSLSQLQVGAVIGRGGAHITQIRQLSGARVQLPAETDEKGERALEVSGSPEQCQAAHSMINHYLVMGRAPPAFPVG